MAQPGNFTPILLYGSSTPGNAPLAANLTNSATGSEIAINVADKNLFFKDSGGVVNTVPIRQSSTSSNGWLSSTDWNTFNNKAPAGAYLTAVTADSPLSGAGTSASHLVIAQASTSTSGYLSNTDWNTFNGKAPAVTYTTNYIPYGQGTTIPLLSAGLQYNGTTFTTTGISTSNNLTFTGTGNRITGLMDGTHVNRLSFQTSTVNAATGPFIIPNGTATSASIVVANASDPTNSSFGQLIANGSTDIRINAGILGTGTYLPLTLFTGGSERLRVFTSGGVSIGNTTDPGAANLSVTGYLTLGSSPSTSSGQVVRINEVFIATYASGNSTTSSTVLGNGVWSLFTQTQSSANAATYGLYVIHRMGTSTAVSTVTNDGGVTVTVNGSYQVVITNASGGARTLQGNLSQQLGQAL